MYRSEFQVGITTLIGIDAAPSEPIMPQSNAVQRSSIASLATQQPSAETTGTEAV